MSGDIDTLARTIWGEARGEVAGGMEAVACVIMNRVRYPRWWGSSVITVCRSPWQFSCWNVNDPNRVKLITVTEDDPQFAQALAIARRAVAGELADTTNGADSYADLRVVQPSWAIDSKVVAKIGNHTFYRLEIPPPS